MRRIVATGRAAAQILHRCFRLSVLVWVALYVGVLPQEGEANDILRGGTSTAASSATSTSSGENTSTTTAAAATPSAQDRLARTTQALTAVRQMQEAARKLAIAGPNNLKAGLPTVPLNSYGLTNGLVLAAGVPKDLLKPTVSENPLLWTGAKLPQVTSQTTSGTTTSNVTIEQTQQQAILNWQSMNVGKNTTLTFDQKAGGADVGQWIAFNYVRDPTGSPTQVLGSIKTIGVPDALGHEQVGGQVYVMNSNGIIFGGSSQVNTHGLVASSLPINYNLIQRGLINNPDAQFLFSALAQDAGSKGPTAAFDPAIASVDGWAPVQTPYAADGSGAIGNYGDVIVQPGALLTAPTSADHVGGRIALVGANVTNAGTISTADGQTILAAGLQVGFVAHNSADPTLRGLDVFVGKVGDDSLPNQSAAGAATNAGLDAANLGVNTTAFNTKSTNSTSLNVLGLIDSPRGSIYITGSSVDQSGVLNSTTSVSYNGRVDIVAGYNAVGNLKYDPSPIGASDFTNALPFLYQSNVGNTTSGATVANSGTVVFGRDSVVQIMPETGSTERIVGDQALPSQVNVQGQSVHFVANSTLLVPGAAVPLFKALGSDGAALEAGVTISAGLWFNPGGTSYRFVHTDDAQQIYLDKGAVIDVAGLAGVSAGVAENIIDVELRGSELANSPLQRDGPLRGETIQVDVRQHGTWDPTLNGGLGGYAWIGTPLADTSGWIGLATHTVAELTTNGGTVSFKAGGAVVLQTGATIDVSGGSIAYAGGYTHTSKVISGGHIYDISKASADLNYDGVYTGLTTTFDSKWGISESTFNGLALGTYENGYTQGGNGGSLAITGAVMALDGTLRGNTVAGAAQRTLSPLYNPASPPAPSNPKVAGVPGWLMGGLNLPIPSQLSIAVSRQYLLSNGLSADYTNYSPTPADIVFRSASILAQAENFRSSGNYLFPIQRNYELDLSTDLVDNVKGAGFGILRIDDSDDNQGLTDHGVGKITVASGAFLNLPAGGSLSLAAANIIIADNTKSTQRTGIQATDGWIGLTAYDVSPSLAQFIGQQVGGATSPVYDPLRGGIVVGSGAMLSTAGALVDDRPSSLTAGSEPLVMAGGQVSITGNNIVLKSGSVVDVSGGADLGSSGKLAYGNSGAISILSGKAFGTGFGSVLGGSLQMTGAILKGYAGVGKTGGLLTMKAPSISIVDALSNGALIATSSTTGALSVSPGFFNTGGFSSLSFIALGVAVDAKGELTGALPAFVIGSPDKIATTTSTTAVATATIIQPKVQNWQSFPGGSVYTAEEGVRSPAKLTFNVVGQQFDANNNSLGNDTSLVVRANATVVTDAGGSVSLGASTVDFLGRVITRGGSILVADNGDKALANLPTIHLGPASIMDVSGATTSTFDFNGYHASDVLDGGTIKLDGNIVAEGAGFVKDENGKVLLDKNGIARQGTGALLNVSGWSDTIFLAPGDPSAGFPTRVGTALEPIVKTSSGGTLTLLGERELFSLATLLGAPGAPASGQATTAQGGELIVASALKKVDGTQPAPSDPVLILAASTPKFVYTKLGQQVTDGTKTLGDAEGFGLIWFGADSFNKGGFGSLTLKSGPSALQVQGNVALSAGRQISIADGGVLRFSPVTTGSTTTQPVLSLSAPYVILGRSFLGPLQASEQSNPFAQNVLPSNGTGVLLVQAASLIDVGNLVLQGVGTAVLDATNGGRTNGAIRGDGTFDVAGGITLKAGQIYPPTAVTFSVNAFDYTLNGAVKSGSVTILGSGISTPAQLPLSAGGTLNIFASIIDQGGVLRAPLGTINLGGSSGDIDLLSGQNLPVTSFLTLQPGSVTSVSAINPVTGLPITIPYGINVNGDTWIDPAGTDITNIGPAAKSITLTASSIDFQDGGTNLTDARIDLTGGGDLYAYQFVPGTGGTKDLLGNAAGSFAIIPANSDLYAPYAPYNQSTEAALSLGADVGYVVGNSSLKYKVGDRIHLEGGGNLPAGDYTLLPARYATLADAYLVTPTKGDATAGAARSVTQPDGSTVMSGYRFNGFGSASNVQDQFYSFKIAPQSVVLTRAEYASYSANSFFADAAKDREEVAPRLPGDAGQLVLAAASALTLQGTVLMSAASNGRGGFVDISSGAEILIGSKSVLAGLSSVNKSGKLLLNSAELSSFGADSLLVGGIRSSGTDGTTVTVTSNKLTVDNAGEALTGSDVILVANKELNVSANAEIAQTRTLSTAAEKLLLTDSIQLNSKTGNNSLTVSRGGTAINFPSGLPLGESLTPTVSGTITAADGTTTTFLADAAIGASSLAAGSTITLSAAGTLTAKFNTTGDPIAVMLGDGVALRVASDVEAQIERSGVISSTSPKLTVSAGAKISGNSITLDSTNATVLDATAKLVGKALALDSGQISFQLDGAGTLQPTTGLVLPASTLKTLQAGADSLSLLSYSSIDIYGSGTIGALDSAGKPTLSNLALHAGEIRGFSSAGGGGDVTFAAKKIVLDNTAGAASPGSVKTTRGALVFDAGDGTIELGANTLNVDQYDRVTLKAAGGLLATDTGTFTVQKDLSLATSLITAKTGAQESIVAAGNLKLTKVDSAPTVATNGLGAQLTLTGATVALDSDITLHSGALTAHATTGDMSVGTSAASRLDVSGTKQSFYDVDKFTNAGQISFASDSGSVSIGKVAVLDVAAQSGGGSAGSLQVSAPGGALALADTAQLLGRGGLDGLGGADGSLGGKFALDTGALISTAALDAALNAGTVTNANGTTTSKGGFVQSRSIRVRSGDVTIDGAAMAHTYELSADQGTIVVTEKGKIDASGLAVDGAGKKVDVAAKLADGTWKTDADGHVLDAAGNTIELNGGTGGTIKLAAHRSVVLQRDALLTVAATYVDAAGKGGAVSLEAGSSVDGVAPSKTDVRDATTQAFLKSDTPVVDIQTESTIDLSVAANSVALAAGQKYTTKRGSAGGDLLVADVGGTITTSDGSTVAFPAGILPSFDTGSSITLNTSGHLTYLADGIKGAYTGTLHLRAPQTTPAAPIGTALALPPDVQINPINGAIVNPSSIVIEGYKTYSPIAGYIDSVEVDIDTNGRSFASADNTNSVLNSLTKNWSSGANAVLGKTAGTQLHVRLGAEVVSAVTTPTVNTITYSAPGSGSSLSVPEGTTLTLPSTTDPVSGISTNTLIFTSASVLKPVNAGNYTYTVNSIGTSTPVTGTPLPLNVLTATTITVTGTIAANRLASTVAGTIKLSNGTTSTFAAGILPALSSGSTLTFGGAGTISSASATTVTGISLGVKNTFVAGSTVSLPANSTVLLGTDGGIVTFTNAGTLTWSTRTVTTNAFAVKLSSDGKFSTGPTGTVVAVSGGNGSVLSLNKTAAGAGSTLTLSAGGTLVFPEGTFTTTNAANTLQVGSSSTSSTAPFSVTVKASQGGTLASITGSITTQKGGTQTLAKKTLDSNGVQLDAGGTLSFGASGSGTSLVTASAAGVIALPTPTLNASGIAIPSTGGTVTISSETSVPAGVIVSSVGGTITSPTGVITTFTANNVPAIAAGSVIAIAGGTLKLSSTSTVTSVSVAVTNNLPAATPTLIAANSVVKFTGSVIVGTASGTASNVTINSNLVVGKARNVAAGDTVRLTSAADVVKVQSTSAWTLTNSGPVSLVFDALNSTSSKVSFLSGDGSILAAVPAGSYSTTGATELASSSANDLILASSWDLSTYRYGPNVDPNKPGSGEPGILTMRAPGNMVFSYTGTTTTQTLPASLSDGFAPTTPSTAALWQAPLLSVGSQSWSYRLTAGADLTAADFHQVQSMNALGSTSGSLLLGKGSGTLPTEDSVSSVSRSVIIPLFYQTIRTGTGDIDIAAGRDVQLLNPLASIYTAGTTASPLANFDVPVLGALVGSSTAATPYYSAQYNLAGGNITISAQNDIARYLQIGTLLSADSSKEMPTNWLYRRSNVGSDGHFTTLSGAPTSEIQSTSWWIDFSNFFADVGALGGGNLSLAAGRNINNIDASVPTNARMPGKDLLGNTVAPDASKLVELGGGNLTVRAGGDIDGGVYYVERGNATLHADGSIKSNATRTAFLSGENSDPVTWLPTTFFVGKGSIDASADGDLRIGQVANPFWLPQGLNNRLYETTYFSTMDPTDSVSLSSLTGAVVVQGQASETGQASNGSAAWLLDWYANSLSADLEAASASQPWLSLSLNDTSSIPSFQTVAAVMPGTLRVTAYSGDINLIGSLILAPASTGTVDLLTAGNITGLTVNGVNGDSMEWRTAVINLSDTDPMRLPSIVSSITFPTFLDSRKPVPLTLLEPVDALFAASGQTGLSLTEKLALHAQILDSSGQVVALHYNDPEPVHLYAAGGDLSGLTLYSGKSTRAAAAHDITDIGFYVQNVRPQDSTVMAAGRDLVAYDPASRLRIAAQQPGNLLAGLAGDTGPAGGTPTAGDIQIAGPGALEVLAGRNLTLGSGNKPTSDGTAAGVTSIGSTLNPALAKYPSADIVAAAGVQSIYSSSASTSGIALGLAATNLDFADFITQFLDPDTADTKAKRYLPFLGSLMGLTVQNVATIWSTFAYQKGQPLTEHQAMLLVDVFHRVIRDAGRDRNDPASTSYRTYTNGLAAIAALFPGSPLPDEDALSSTNPSDVVVRPAGAWLGSISLATREIKTFEGSNITLLAPGGGITVGRPSDPQKPDQGVLTERGGNISVYSADSVNVGTSRIFTLRGGNESIWSTWGNIAAGSGSKTVFSAPPTRVLIDPQSADVKNDLAGLATGSGIGVLATLSGVKPGDVDLVAPVGTIDAGDAGIRASGNVNLAGRVILNAGNIQTGGNVTGAPPPPAPPNIAGLSSASNASAAAGSSATEVAKQGPASNQATELPSLITVEVLGYGGGDGDENISQNFPITIDGKEYEWAKPTMTVAELRVLAGIPAGQPMIVETPDGQQRALADDEVITLESGRPPEARPHYKRG